MRMPRHLSSLDDDIVNEFNLDFGPVIKKDEDDQYVFSAKEATISEHRFRFDLARRAPRLETPFITCLASGPARR